MSKNILTNASEIESPNECPVCKSSFVTTTLQSWICADCGATEEDSYVEGKDA